ncbi:MAG TPA: discoidin domain-containing protein, partial [Polyangiales bacterium]
MGVLAALVACREPRARAPAPGPLVSTREAPRTLDAFEEPALWQARASDDVLARAEPVPGKSGRALRLAFDFRGHSGYAALQRPLSLTLPAHYEIAFDVRGEAPVNDLQFKLADASGENVWWFRRNDFAPSSSWQHVVIKQRQIEFAWGPTQQRELREAASVELVVYAGREVGSGFIEIDGLTLRELPPPPQPPAPIASASTSLPDHAPARALDGRADTSWRSGPSAGKGQELTLDLGIVREFGGLVLRWDPAQRPARYDVQLSQDGLHWQPAGGTRRGGQGDVDALRLPESEARFVRLRLQEGPAAGYALRELEVRELAFGASPNDFLRALAREAPRGRYPRGFSGEQPYWTLVGSDGAGQNGLLSEDGALELSAGGVSVEPFVISEGQLLSWADVAIDHSLHDGALPIPRSTWRHARFELEVEAFASGTASNSSLWGRYTLKNLARSAIDLQLVLAVRPLQVNPPTQFLNIAGGVSPIRALAWDGTGLAVNGATALFPVSLPEHAALARFDPAAFPLGPVVTAGRAAASVADDDGLASGALVYALQLEPGQSTTLGVMAPLTREPGAAAPAPPTADSMARARDETLTTWREKLGRFSIRVPPAAQPLVDSLRSALAHVLMSRSGPILRPGTRSYARSWIRDGAMMAEVLLRLGHEQVAREYLTWFAPYLFENGKVPCCVDRRGADPVVENDSAGEFIFLVAELYRYTHDRVLLQTLWPRVEAAASYMEQLRQAERTTRNQHPARRAFYGLMPPSISHEGYSDKPAYSYWDDFWALIGYEDATFLAEAAGQTEAHARLAKQRDEFRADLIASVQESARQHGVNYIPGSADRGDFDATSTTIALAPGRAESALPRELLTATFERYFAEFEARRDGKRSWRDYTPYELRVVGSMLRLGAPERAHALLGYFFADQRPQGWNQWAEVVGREPREPRFIGDMPHAWIASDYIRAALDLFAYARPLEQELVLAAGVLPEWLSGEGVTVENLRTPYG